MKKYIKYIAGPVLGLIAMSACSRVEITGQNQESGYLYVSLDRDDSEELVFKHTKANNTSFTLKIYDEQNELTRTVENADAAQAQNLVELNGGSYTMTASNFETVPTAAFDSPYYYGEAAFDVIPGQVTNASITCTLANVKVTATFSQDILDDFKTCKLTVSNGSGDLVFSNTDGTIDQAGYFSDTGTLTWKLELVNNDDQSYGPLTDTYTNVHGQQHYNLSFSLEDPEQVAAGAVTIILNDEMSEKKYDMELDFSEDVVTRN